MVRGGESRCHSVLLAALEASPEAKLLAVQDGARPLVTPELIDDVAEQAARCGAAAPAVAVKDTIKAVRDDGTVAETLDRAALRAVQTPQIFESALLKAALQAAVEGGIPITDDCSAVERLGKRVYLVEGDEENLKITTPLDLVLGLSGCHSSLLKKFKAVAEEHQVNLYQLIVEVSARDQKSPSDELMAKTAAALQ